MRYSSKHKAETRRRIVDEASRRLRKDGIDGTGLVPLMKALGLTHGGFYAHFESKDALVLAALDAAAEQALDKWQASDGPDKLGMLVDGYLSARQRDNPDQGCPLPTLAAELGLRGRPSPTADLLVDHMSARLEEVELHASGADQGLLALATMIGALTLARAVADGATSQRILDAARHALRTPGVKDSAPAVRADRAAE